MKKKSDKEKNDFKIPNILAGYHWIILAGSLGLTLFAWRFSVSQANELLERRFNFQTTQTLEHVKERMKKYEDALWGGVGAIYASENDIDLGSWVRFSKALDLKRKYPGINGIGVIFSVPEKELESFIEKQKAYQPFFKVHPKHNKNEFLPITYIDPAESNFAAIGLDMVHEENRYQAAIAARDTGKAQITGPIILVQDNEKTPGFLFYAPFYAIENEDKASKKKDSFKGLVYAPFIMKKLMSGTLANSERKISISISDNDTELYNEHNFKNKAFDPNPLFSKKVSIDFYGRKWNFDIRTSLSFREEATLAQANIILYAGILIDSLLFFIFLLLSRSNRRALDIARRMTQDLEVANKAKDTFISNMSHELRTPLTTIIGYTELLIEDSLEKKDFEAKEKGEIILDSTNYLLSLVTDVLDVSILNFGELTIKREKFLVEEFLSKLEKKGHTLAEKKQNKFKINNLIKEKTIYFDKGRLYKVIIILISNSSKFTSNGLISLDLESKNKNLTIKVKDTGKGIPQKETERIFNLFEQAHDISKEPLSGVGVGLFLAKNLVSLMGGSISVTSEENVGTTFNIKIPFNRKDEDKA